MYFAYILIYGHTYSLSALTIGAQSYMPAYVPIHTYMCTYMPYTYSLWAEHMQSFIRLCRQRLEHGMYKDQVETATNGIDDGLLAKPSSSVDVVMKRVSLKHLLARKRDYYLIVVDLFFQQYPSCYNCSDNFQAFLISKLEYVV